MLRITIISHINYKNLSYSLLNGKLIFKSYQFNQILNSHYFIVHFRFFLLSHAYFPYITCSYGNSVCLFLAFHLPYDDCSSIQRNDLCTLVLSPSLHIRIIQYLLFCKVNRICWLGSLALAGYIKIMLKILYRNIHKSKLATRNSRVKTSFNIRI